MYVEDEVLTRNLDGRKVNGGEIPLLPFIAGIQWQLYTQWQTISIHSRYKVRSMDKVRNMSPGWAISSGFYVY
jgi:hypothetical protein